MNTLIRTLICSLSLVWILPGQEPTASQLQGFSPLPAVVESKTNPVTPEKVELGRMLYFENRLSKSQKFSCNSCHGLNSFGVDNQPTSDGDKGQRGDRNSPTVFNAAGHFVQFWDGRAADVEAQAKGPVMNPVEMAMTSEAAVVAVLKSIPEYPGLFAKAFPGQKDPVTFDNMAKAIGAFERKLLTPSRWDAYLKGKKDALTPAEKAGFIQFVSTGCATCHNGTYIGGEIYGKIGLAHPYPETGDPGRYKVTKKEEDRNMFKVPSLRNVAKTQPYFHNGKVATLDDAVNRMAEYQLGKKLSAVQVKSITTWLNTLTGELPPSLAAPPKLPPNGPKTPKPSTTD